MQKLQRYYDLHAKKMLRYKRDVNLPVGWRCTKKQKATRLNECNCIALLKLYQAEA